MVPTKLGHVSSARQRTLPSRPITWKFSFVLTRKSNGSNCRESGRILPLEDSPNPGSCLNPVGGASSTFVSTPSGAMQQDQPRAQGVLSGSGFFIYQDPDVLRPQLESLSHLFRIAMTLINSSDSAECPAAMVQS